MNKNIAQYNNEDIDKLKLICKHLFLKKEKIHIFISKDRKRKKEIECEIVGVYPRFMNVKYYENDKENTLTITYVDIMIKNLIINELESLVK